MKAAGIAVHGRGRECIKTKPAISEEVSTDLGSNPAITGEVVSADPLSPAPTRAPSAPMTEALDDELAVRLTGRWRFVRQSSASDSARILGELGAPEIDAALHQPHVDASGM